MPKPSPAKGKLQHEESQSPTDRPIQLIEATQAFPAGAIAQACSTFVLIRLGLGSPCNLGLVRGETHSLRDWRDPWLFFVVGADTKCSKDGTCIYR